jgi:hypothetical protein
MVSKVETHPPAVSIVDLEVDHQAIGQSFGYGQQI